MAATVVSDDPVTLREEEEHLGVPVIGGQRPAVSEDDRLPLAPVLVEDLDAVLGLDRAHGSLLPLGGRPSPPRRGERDTPLESRAPHTIRPSVDSIGRCNPFDETSRSLRDGGRRSTQGQPRYARSSTPRTA